MRKGGGEEFGKRQGVGGEDEGKRMGGGSKR